MNTNFDPQDFEQEDQLAKADTWLEQLEVIGSLMDLEEQLDTLPSNWENIMQEPDPEELAVMDANALEFLDSLQG